MGDHAGISQLGDGPNRGNGGVVGDDAAGDHLHRGMGAAHGLHAAPAKIGKKGGTKTAERGPDYFRQIAAMRKTRAGGRPKKQVTP
jgi:hypothetical protein